MAGSGAASTRWSVRHTRGNSARLHWHARGACSSPSRSPANLHTSVLPPPLLRSAQEQDVAVPRRSTRHDPHRDLLFGSAQRTHPHLVPVHSWVRPRHPARRELGGVDRHRKSTRIARVFRAETPKLPRRRSPRAAIDVHPARSRRITEVSAMSRPTTREPSSTRSAARSAMAMGAHHRASDRCSHPLSARSEPVAVSIAEGDNVQHLNQHSCSSAHHPSPPQRVP